MSLNKDKIKILLLEDLHANAENTSEITVMTIWSY